MLQNQWDPVLGSLWRFKSFIVKILTPLEYIELRFRGTASQVSSQAMFLVYLCPGITHSLRVESTQRSRQPDRAPASDPESQAERELRLEVRTLPSLSLRLGPELWPEIWVKSTCIEYNKYALFYT